MTVRLYQSTDAGAPTLNGQAGSLAAVLDACLVNGYGAKAAAGWSIAYTATNKRAYKQGAGGNHPTGIHLYIDDTGPGTGVGREARCAGFETMSAITPVGTGQFPNSTQSNIGAGYLVIRKSNATTAEARTWYVIADAHTFYLFVETGDRVAPNIIGCAFMFGDFKSYKSGDAYAQMIIGRCVEFAGLLSSGDGWYETFSCVNAGTNYGVNDNMPGHFFSRHWNQLAVSVRGGKMTNSITSGGTGTWPGNDATTCTETANAPGFNQNNPEFFPYPNAVDGAMWMAPFYVNQNGIRGYLKGLWCPQHHRPLNPGDTFTAANGSLSGKSFIALHSHVRQENNNVSEAAQFFVEFSDTWPA